MLVLPCVVRVARVVGILLKREHRGQECLRNSIEKRRNSRIEMGVRKGKNHRARIPRLEYGVPDNDGPRTHNSREEKDEKEYEEESL